MLPIMLLLALQAVDVGLHMATDQFELMRTAASVLAAGGAISMLFLARQAQWIGWISAGGYLVLNVLFLAQNGIENPATGALRLPLFGFVALTVIFIVWCIRRAVSAR